MIQVFGTKKRLLRLNNINSKTLVEKERENKAKRRRTLCLGTVHERTGDDYKEDSIPTPTLFDS